MMSTQQIKSKERVREFAEVLTPHEIVCAMLDLVKTETERIDSRFLEPACGTGNFLIEILERKLKVVNKRYSRVQLEWERYAVLAVSSIYGIDILKDNAQECRNRLYEVFDRHYTAHYKRKTKEDCRKTVRYILERNIVWGDALTLKSKEDGEPIVFSEWSLVNGSYIKRRDFRFDDLAPGLTGGSARPSKGRGIRTGELFTDAPRGTLEYSDTGRLVLIPEPYEQETNPPVHFLEVHRAYAK